MYLLKAKQNFVHHNIDQVVYFDPRTRMKLDRIFATLWITLSLVSCGGGGGSTPTSFTLASNIGTLEGQHLALGDPRQLQQTTWVSQWLDPRNWQEWGSTIAGLLMGAAHAQQITIANCAETTLLGSLDAIHWSPIALTQDPKTNACINQMQDAGRFLVLKASNVTNSAGQLLSLIHI
jgi:hypothetical protein